MRIAFLIGFLWTVSLATPVFSQETQPHLNDKKTAPIEPPDALDGPPFVTAKAWAIADGRTGKLLWGNQEKTPRQIASTTKIMTAWIVLQLAAEDQSILEETVTVSERADKTGGSTAGVLAGEQLTVGDLLYGLLLPSGNDAAVALGEHFGERFRIETSPSANEKESPKKDALACFVEEMNRRAASLEMAGTKYFDPHGNSKNQAACADLVKLASSAMKNPLFQKYVKTRQHECTIKTPKNGERTAQWKNTNQLLGIAGYEGVKTGTTGGAGACLVSSGRRGDDQLLIVVLGCARDSRYIDTRNLYRWAWLQRGHKPAESSNTK